MDKIIRNSAKCAHCDVELVSTHVHDYRTHTCVNGPVIGKQRKWVPAPELGPDREKLVETEKDEHPFFAVDGGTSYIRRGFTRKEDYIETSIIEEE